MEDERSYLLELVKLIPDKELHTAVRFLEFLAFSEGREKKGKISCSGEIKRKTPKTVKKTEKQNIREISEEISVSAIPEGVTFTGVKINEADGSKLEEARKAMEEDCFITPEDYLRMVSSKEDASHC
ncbi:MAG: hypothetical protein LWY06_15250 [Firmicutes bacterium]|nr:hypothetical protein [Bacillota bacterium]